MLSIAVTEAPTAPPVTGPLPFAGPVPGGVVGQPTPAARRRASEQDAFEAWMAVAPAFTPWDGETGERDDPVAADGHRRSRWVLPLEVALVLLAVAIVVVAALVVLG